MTHFTLHSDFRKKVIRIGAALLVASSLFAFVLPAPAEASEEKAPWVYHFTRDAAQAGFQIDDGCLTTNIQMYPMQFFIQQPPGSPEKSVESSMGIYRFDRCLGIVQINALLETPNIPYRAFDIREKRAELNVSVELTDYVSGNKIPLTVHMNWVRGDEVTSEEAFNTHINEEGCAQNTHFVYKTWAADVYGTVSFLGETYSLSSPYSASMEEWGENVVVIEPCPDD